MPLSYFTVFVAACMRWAPIVMKRGNSSLQAFATAPPDMTMLRDA